MLLFGVVCNVNYTPPRKGCVLSTTYCTGTIHHTADVILCNIITIWSKRQELHILC